MIIIIFMKWGYKLNLRELSYHREYTKNILTSECNVIIRS